MNSPSMGCFYLLWQSNKTRSGKTALTSQSEFPRIGKLILPLQSKLSCAREFTLMEQIYLFRVMFIVNGHQQSFYSFAEGVNQHR